MVAGVDAGLANYLDPDPTDRRSRHPPTRLTVLTAQVALVWVAPGPERVYRLRLPIV